MVKLIVGGTVVALFLLGTFIHELGSYCDDVCPQPEDWRSE